MTLRDVRVTMSADSRDHENSGSGLPHFVESLVVGYSEHDIGEAVWNLAEVYRLRCQELNQAPNWASARAIITFRRWEDDYHAKQADSI